MAGQAGHAGRSRSRTRVIEETHGRRHRGDVDRAVRVRPAPLRPAGPVHDAGRHRRARADGHRARGRVRGHDPGRPATAWWCPFNISCGTCWMCTRGLHSQCETTQNRDTGTGASLLGYSKLYGQVPGGQAELLRVPVRRHAADQGAARPGGRPLPVPLRRAAHRVAGRRVRRRRGRAARCWSSAPARSATWPRGSPCTAACASSSSTPCRERLARVHGRGAETIDMHRGRRGRATPCAS